MRPLPSAPQPRRPALQEARDPAIACTGWRQLLELASHNPGQETQGAIEVGGGHGAVNPTWRRRR